MIVKKRNTPRILRQLRALKSRLYNQHPQFSVIVQNEIRRANGFKGEASVDYYLSDLLENDFFIFHDLRLPFNDDFFQIDTLILTHCYMAIIEIKNFAGSLYFDPVFSQMIRTLNGQEECFFDPIAQVKRQQMHLDKWMDLHQLPKLPIYYFIAISNPETLIKTPPGNSTVPGVVFHAHQVPEKIRSIRRAHRKERITADERKKISRYLTRYHTPYDIDILNKFHINEEELITGVGCPNCSAIPMKPANRGTWFCSSCGCTSINAHISATHDYFLLKSKTITNEQFRIWTHLKSRKTATRLLKNMRLPIFGAKRGTKYRQPPDFDDA
ncbi:NERD domain-containing protein [Sporolactobacillus sp. THM7-7]|nr:NERD domain-containing protein [Sporolactobacillus sp. THM7-7]